ncbi:MAG: U32 family peptidase [Deltaproteobacteria bacterium]|jgi:putative protease|nr:U32 family peptidase [Deltaproteobacteria bacterium]
MAEDKPEPSPEHPDILAPAGDMRSALAALAAGADAVYLGLKHFSARMQAENFSTAALIRLTDLAHSEGRKIYVALNSLLRQDETDHILRLIRELVLNAPPDALIIQDLALLDLARQAGFTGELHLSTLANVTHPEALRAARSLGANRVILPRELSLEEIRRMDALCPEGLDLEIFVHGALCHCVSGRCWWSSYMGGKSGLRGRCVQPCRRVYRQKGREGRFFASQDLSLDALARRLLFLPRLKAWKIEGRKKGPHYVYYVTSAYRLLRDAPQDKDSLGEALEILKMALGRPGERTFFLRKTPSAESATGKPVQTGSGLFIGAVGRPMSGGYEFQPRIPLLPRDFLRIGHEDEPWHCTISVPGAVPSGKTFPLRLPRGKQPKADTPVFLIDRQAPELLALLKEWEKNLGSLPSAEHAQEKPASLCALQPAPAPFSGLRPKDILLRASLPHGRDKSAPGIQGLWLSPKAVREVSRTLHSRISWWLPPVIWPEEEALWSRLIAGILRNGARHVVCNAPWQIAFFPNPADMVLTAGPFCNTANALALEVLRRAGFSKAVISPELGEADILSLPAKSPLPLGLVISGFWPMGISRRATQPLNTRDSFTSPRNEEFWLRRYGPHTWIYPAWPLDLAARRPALARAGYAFFIAMPDHPPATLAQTPRPGEFNWHTGIL